MENEKHLPVIKEFGEVFTRLIYVVIRYKETNEEFKLTLNEVPFEMMKDIECGRAEVIANKELFTIHIQSLFDTNDKEEYKEICESDSRISIGPSFLISCHFEPEYVAVELLDSREKKCYTQMLTNLSSKDLIEMNNGYLQIVANIDLFDSYIRQISPDDNAKIAENKDIFNSFVQTLPDESIVKRFFPEGIPKLFDDDWNPIDINSSKNSNNVNDDRGWNEPAVNHNANPFEITDDDEWNWARPSLNKKVEKYMHLVNENENKYLSEINCVALSVIALSTSLNPSKPLNIEKIAEIVGNTLMNTFGIDKDEYEFKYKEKVLIQTTNMCDLVNSLEFYQIPTQIAYRSADKIKCLSPTNALFTKIFNQNNFPDYKILENYFRFSELWTLD